MPGNHPSHSVRPSSEILAGVASGDVLPLDRILRLEPGSEECKAAVLSFLRHELATLDNLIVTDKHVGPLTWRTSTHAASKALEWAFGLSRASRSDNDP